MKVFGVQLDTQWENKGANFARVRALVLEAAPPPGSLIVLPEMFSTGFSMNVPRIADEAGETARFLSDLAGESQSIILGGLVTKNDDGRGRNEAFVAAPDGTLAARYCKIHPFTFSGENAHYAAGEELALFDWQGFEAAPLICYDLRFPELFRDAARRGATLFCVIANWPASRETHWLTLLRARAIENQAYIIGVNRCGADPKLSYSGRSQIIDPRGEIIADAGELEGIVGAALNLEELENYRRDFPALSDMKWRQF